MCLFPYSISRVNTVFEGFSIFEWFECFLKVNGFADSLTLNLTEGISQKDSRLTLGMKRIISLVRIMIRKPKIVLLDEITSGLDSHTEMLICDYIQKISMTTLCIVITHKSEDLFIEDEVLELGRKL